MTIDFGQGDLGQREASARPQRGDRQAPIEAALVVSPMRAWACAAVAVGALLAAGVVWWFDPHRQTLLLCTLHTVTGWYCVGCGATRATHDLLHGRLLSALSYNALWTLTLPVFTAVGGLSLVRYARGRPLPAILNRPGLYLGYLAVAAAFMALRNLPWHPFSLLAPPG